MAQPLPLDEALRALKRDPTHPVRVKVDDELTIELRAVNEQGPNAQALPPGEKSAADAFREVGLWEGERGEELTALFENIRQRTNRRVPDLP